MTLYTKEDEILAATLRTQKRAENKTRPLVSRDNLYPQKANRHTLPLPLSLSPFTVFSSKDLPASPFIHVLVDLCSEMSVTPRETLTLRVQEQYHPDCDFHVPEWHLQCNIRSQYTSLSPRKTMGDMVRVVEKRHSCNRSSTPTKIRLNTHKD